MRSRNVNDFLSSLLLDEPSARVHQPRGSGDGPSTCSTVRGKKWYLP
jgi:hypothetical protein